MATASRPLTLDEFHARYRGQKPHFEYWFGEAYPTQPVPVVAEMFSPDDAFPHVIRKCRQYARIGIEKIFILDPEGREAWEWNAAAERPETIQRLALPNGAAIQLADVWRDLEEQL